MELASVSEVSRVMPRIIDGRDTLPKERIITQQGVLLLEIPLGPGPLISGTD